MRSFFLLPPLPPAAAPTPFALFQVLEMQLSLARLKKTEELPPGVFLFVGCCGGGARQQQE